MKSSGMTILSVSIVAVVLVISIYFIIQQKLKQQATAFYHQLENVRYELNTKTNAIDSAAYEKEPGDEHIIYDGNKSIEQNFRGQGARAWDYVSHGFSGGTGKGSHQIKNGVIAIQRLNTEGRYELYLQKYAYNNGTENIQADSSINKRRLRLNCEVKRDNASHLLRFVFKGEQSKNVLDEKDYVVFSPQWEQVNVAFTISANEPSYLRIDDLAVLEAPSGVQIRNIVLYEKK